MILKKEDFQRLLFQKLTLEKLDQFLKHNFPSMHNLKMGYLDKILQEVKKAKSNEVDVRFEEIEDYVSFQTKDIVPLIEDILTGIQSKRKKRDKNCLVIEKDNSHRIGYLTFISVVWMELGNEQRKC